MTGFNAGLGKYLSVGLVALVGGTLTLRPMIDRNDVESTRIAVDLPAQTTKALKSNGGVSYREMRDNGLSLTIEEPSSGVQDPNIALAVFVLAVNNDRITDVWTSRTISLLPGEHKLPGDQFLPGDKFVPGEFISGTERWEFLPGDQFLDGLESRSMKEITRGTGIRPGNGLLIVVSSPSADEAPNVATKPVFVMITPVENP